VLSSHTSGSHFAENAGQLVGNPVIELTHRGALPFRSRLKLQAL
jgi:hypothetical protein